MQINKYITIAAIALIFSCGGALGFKDVSTSSVPGAGSRDVGVSGGNINPDSKVKLDSTGSHQKENGGGIVLKIPGIGRLGTLPKLNFGLELLYGVNEETQQEKKEYDDGFTVKGSVRKNF